MTCLRESADLGRRAPSHFPLTPYKRLREKPFYFSVNTRMDSSDAGIHNKMEQVEARLSGGILEVADDLEKLKERVKAGARA